MFKHMKDERPKIDQQVVICTIDPRGYKGSYMMNKKDNIKFEIRQWSRHDESHQRFLMENPGDQWNGPETRMWCPAENILSELAELAIDTAMREANHAIASIRRSHDMGGASCQQS